MKRLTETLQAMINKLGKLEDLEETIGCPLDVRCKVVSNSTIYDCRCKQFTVYNIYDNYFRCTCENDVHYIFRWNEYRINWWLKPDRRE